MLKRWKDVVLALCLVTSVTAFVQVVRHPGAGHRLGTDIHYPPISGGGGGISSVVTAAPASGNGTSGSPVTVVAATSSVAGSMSAADKAKLDGTAGTSVCAGSDQASLSFSPASDGGGYEVAGEWVTSGSLDDGLIMQLNGVTTGYTTSVLYANNTASFYSSTGDVGQGAVTGGFSIGVAGGNSGRNRMKFRVLIYSTAGSHSAWVIGTAEAYASATGNAFQWFMPQGVFATASPISTVTFTTKGGGSTEVKAGSCLAWRPLNFTAAN